jgi:uncharacterized protein with GYD domain
MGHYLFRASYTIEGLKGLLAEGAESRIKALEAVFASVGGKLDHMYWTFGDADVMLTAADVDRARGLQVAYRKPGA